MKCTLGFKEIAAAMALGVFAIASIFLAEVT